jgi:hypothetical protein
MPASASLVGSHITSDVVFVNVSCHQQTKLASLGFLGLDYPDYFATVHQDEILLFLFVAEG